MIIKELNGCLHFTKPTATNLRTSLQLVVLKGSFHNEIVDGSLKFFDTILNNLQLEIIIFLVTVSKSTVQTAYDSWFAGNYEKEVGILKDFVEF